MARALTEDLLAREQFSREWSKQKITHEMVWSEAESLVLGHLQVSMFETVKDDTDWWMILRKAYEDHVEEIYRLMMADLGRPGGWIHPTIATATNEQFVAMEDKILSSVQKEQ